MHVNPVPTYSGAGTSLKSSTGKLADILLENSRKDLKKLLARIEKLPLNTQHTFLPLAFYSDLITTIKNEVKVKNIELIIMGTKGASGLKKVIIGSNTADVINMVKCPLLAVPENTTYSQPKEIAFATDYHLGNNLKVLDSLLKMTTTNKAVLRILHIAKKGEELSTEQFKNKKSLADYLVDIHHSFHSLTGTKLESAVQCFTESRDIDMIAMVAKNQNFFQRILVRPAVEEISYHTEIPFLVLHE